MRFTFENNLASLHFLAVRNSTQDLVLLLSPSPIASMPECIPIHVGQAGVQTVTPAGTTAAKNMASGLMGR